MYNVLISIDIIFILFNNLSFLKENIEYFYLVILFFYFYRNILISFENYLMIIVYTKFIFHGYFTI